MLRRRVGSVAIAAVLMVMGLHNAPLAEASPQLKAGCLEVSRNRKECKSSLGGTVIVDKVGVSGSAGGSGDIEWCVSIYEGGWVRCDSIKPRKFEEILNRCHLRDPQPPKDHPAWEGHADGFLWFCGYFDRHDEIYMWLPSAAPPPDPEVLAKQAVAQLGLRAIEIGIAPRALETDPNSMGAVGMPNWMWVANPGPQTTESQSRTVSENGWSVTISSNLRQVVWDMGDGGPEVFCGAGVPYYVEYGLREAPSCGYRYVKQGVYTVKATSQWEVAWSGLGRSGVIPLEFTTTGSVRIGEIQTVITKSKP